MKLYIFGSNSPKRIKQITTTVHRIAEGTDTNELVVSVYFNHINTWNGGFTLAQQWVTSKFFHPKRGRWRRFAQHPVPENIPSKFKLVRLLLIDNDKVYPLIQKDIYNWTHKYETFQDHLAYLFAHELHHFRRYHLDLHPGEGEQSANKWALKRTISLGFRVESVQHRIRHRKKKKSGVPFAKLYNPSDCKYGQIFLNREKYTREKLLLVERLREKSIGTLVQIIHDPRKIYTGQFATIEKILRRNSFRIVIKTPDKKLWRWPMVWLKEIE
ncbi:hypothetical protein JW935_18885 [candidate division KSB1 bacterium]|nr:hypothetical protein [candidate division KSB1 bacterium]